MFFSFSKTKHVSATNVVFAQLSNTYISKQFHGFGLSCCAFLLQMFDLQVTEKYAWYRLSRLLSGIGPAILVLKGSDPFGQHQGSRPLAGSNTGSPRFTDSLSNVVNLIG